MFCKPLNAKKTLLIFFIIARYVRIMKKYLNRQHMHSEIMKN